MCRDHHLPAIRREKPLPSLPNSLTTVDSHHLMPKAEMSSSPPLPLGWALINPSLDVLML